MYNRELVPCIYDELKYKERPLKSVEYYGEKFPNRVYFEAKIGTTFKLLSIDNIIMYSDSKLPKSYGKKSDWGWNSECFDIDDNINNLSSG